MAHNIMNLSSGEFAGNQLDVGERLNGGPERLFMDQIVYLSPNGQIDIDDIAIDVTRNAPGLAEDRMHLWQRQ